MCLHEGNLLSYHEGIVPGLRQYIPLQRLSRQRTIAQALDLQGACGADLSFSAQISPQSALEAVCFEELGEGVAVGRTHEVSY